MAEIANSIDPHIKVTIDTPEHHGDHRMPVLDLKIYIKDSEECPQVAYSFYKKPCASMFTILKRSAVSESVKRFTIFQEGLKRLLHISPDLPWSESVRHLSEYSNCPRING